MPKVVNKKTGKVTHLPYTEEGKAAAEAMKGKKKMPKGFGKKK
jgi:hypothetical protein